MNGTSAVAVLLLCCAGVPRDTLAQDRDAATFRVQIWGDASVVFGEQMRSYAALREELERGLPPLQVTDDAAAILARTRALAARVREARSRAKPGDIFTRDVRAAFRKALQLETAGNADTCAALLDDNPGSIALPINGTYHSHRPVSTVPATVLAKLPPLPPDVEYRFAERELFLLDTRAYIVVDRMESAVRCRKPK
jgi:hypothetical protein